MGRRTLLLIAALVVAALGTVLIFLYVQNIKDEAYRGATLVQVLVATEEVPVGTTAADASASGAFELQELPQEATADGALSSTEEIANQVAQTPIYPGQQVLAQMFAAPGTASGLSVAKDKLAMSVQLGDPERVAGFVVPGSFVTIFYTDETDTMVIIPRVEVLATGATTISTQTTTTESGEETTAEIPQAILTLETDQEQAQRIIQGQSSGELYFGLLGDDATPRTGRLTNSADLRR